MRGSVVSIVGKADLRFGVYRLTCRLMESSLRLVETLAGIPDVQERLMAVVSRRSRVRELEGSLRTDALRVRGCQSPVWLEVALRDEVVHLAAAAEAALVKGMVFFLCEFYDGRAASDVLADATDPIGAVGFREVLSPTRLNGLEAVRREILEGAARCGEGLD